MTSIHAPDGIVLFSPDFRVKLTIPDTPDNAAIARLRADPRVRTHMPFLPVVKEEEMESLRVARSQDTSILDVVIWARDNDESEQDDEEGLEQATYSFAGVSGIFGLDPIHRSCEAGIIIAPTHQGRSLTTPVFYTLFKYLFGPMNVHRITFETSAQNSGMIRWLEGVGIRKEGERKRAWKGEEGWVDVLSYAVLEEEWKERVRGFLEAKMGVQLDEL